MATVQLNVRIDAPLKQAGEEVLGQLGWSVTKAIRIFWRFLSAHRDDPHAIERVLCAQDALSIEDVARKERERRMALAESGATLFATSCATLGLDAGAFSEADGAIDDAVLEDALYERLEERGLSC